ncbi:hypothetical protein BGW80DRAFT_1384113 [Lactifluus volemus]|nr:hypothetical protein BGW80DRAFT_1384113 [Lactifluus volemus]
MLSYFFPSLTHRLLAVHLSLQPSFLLIKPSSSASPPQILDIHLPTDVTLNKRKKNSQEWEVAPGLCIRGQHARLRCLREDCSLWAPICQGIPLKGHRTAFFARA